MDDFPRVKDFHVNLTIIVSNQADPFHTGDPHLTCDGHRTTGSDEVSAVDQAVSVAHKTVEVNENLSVLLHADRALCAYELQGTSSTIGSV